VKRIISGTRYTDPNDFEYWIKTVSPGTWNDRQTFPPNKKGGWTNNKQIFLPEQKIWRRKT
jgi:hypothetical protein